MAVAPFTQGFIVDLTTLERFSFDFNPDDIADDHPPDIETTKIPGASHPQLSWSNGGSRVISFSLRIVRLDASDPADIVKRRCAWLQSLTYPEDEPDFDQARAPFIQFVMGQLYDLPGIVRKCSVKYPMLSAIELLPEYADIQMSIEEVSPTAITLPQVRTGGMASVRFLPGSKFNG